MSLLPVEKKTEVTVVEVMEGVVGGRRVEVQVDVEVSGKDEGVPSGWGERGVVVMVLVLG